MSIPNRSLMPIGFSCDAHWMRNGCAMDAHWMRGGCAVDARWMRAGCTVDAHWMLIHDEHLRQYEKKNKNKKNRQAHITALRALVPLNKGGVYMLRNLNVH